MSRPLNQRRTELRVGYEKPRVELQSTAAARPAWFSRWSQRGEIALVVLVSVIVLFWMLRQRHP